MAFDIVKALTELGVDEATAEDLKTRLSGSDYLNLVNVLNTPDIPKSVAQANQILRRYGVTLNGDKNMQESKDYLNALFQTIKSGTTIEEAISEWLQPINETNSPDHLYLIAEGFTYKTMVPMDRVEQLTDWLDEQKVEYLTDGKGTFHVKCGTREDAYKIGDKISKIVHSKSTVRDSEAHKESPMSEKKAGKREREAKEKIAAIKPRDMNVVAMNNRSGKGAHREDPRKNDNLDRKAKHRKSPMEEGHEFEIGDAVMVGETQGTVRIPHGPNDTIGVIMEGKLTMVEAADVQPLNEGVMGMTPMKSLFRLRELAGLAPAPELDSETAAIAKEDQPEDLGDIDVSGDDEGLDLPAVEPEADDMGVDADADADLDISEPAGLASDPTSLGGVPGDLPPMGGDDLAPLGVASQSDAMNQIEDALNSIQRQLADIRLSEYKTVIRKLQDLTNQVTMMGRDYLGERRKK